MDNGELSNDKASETKPESLKKRGFAAMDREVVRAIAKKGGISAHLRGAGHEFTSEEARAAGRKGGQSRHRAAVALKAANG